MPISWDRWIGALHLTRLNLGSELFITLILGFGVCPLSANDIYASDSQIFTNINNPVFVKHKKYHSRKTNDKIFHSITELPATKIILVIFKYNIDYSKRATRKFKSGPTFIKPDQRNPWIKDQLWNDLLSTILHLQLPNFVSCGRDKPSHMTQNLVTVGVKL